MTDPYGACSGKAAYPSKAAAIKAREFTLRRRRKNYGHKGGKGGAKLVPYLCPQCHQWHLGGWAGPTNQFGGLNFDRKGRGSRDVGR
jgi:hypothetical protein